MKVEINKLIENKEYCKRVFYFFIKNRTLKLVDSSLYEKYLNKSLNNPEFGNFVFDEHDYSIKEKLPNKKFYDWCVVIHYYAIYHAVSALLTRAGFESKNHLASISALSFVYYHKNNVLSKDELRLVIEGLNIKSEEIEFILDSKGLRERASYRVDEDFNLAIARDLQRKTVDCVNKVKNILEEKGE